jgi:transcriptional regulator with XRE-family HTH domain
MARRLTKQDIQKRVLELESLIGQKNLAGILNVSVDSVRRYREGRTKPQSKKVLEKINRIYNQRKNIISPEKIEHRRKQIERRQRGQREGREKPRYVPIYPDYMYDSPAAEFADVGGFEESLIELSEQGYVAAYYGRDIIPLEVQFVIHGESLERRGKIIHLVGIVSHKTSPNKDNGFTGMDTRLEIFKVHYRLIPGWKAAKDFDSRMEVLRDYFLERQVKDGYTVALLAYYYDENDEI